MTVTSSSGTSVKSGKSTTLNHEKRLCFAAKKVFLNAVDTAVSEDPMDPFDMAAFILAMPAFMWSSTTLPMKEIMKDTTWLLTRSKPICLSMNSFTSRSSSGNCALAFMESTVVKERWTRSIPSTPCWSSASKLKRAAAGKIIVTGVFERMAQLCSKIVHMRSKYTGLSQVSRMATTCPIRHNRLSNVDPSSAAPLLLCSTNMRYWLFTKKHMKKKTSSARVPCWDSSQSSSVSRTVLSR
mmetsp:Transcript_47374/g.120179  ORF Transcript_47374/g.120179 Transcript_47374/m.120179 type:complete len:240 (-) Transcript_47374:64-783(-)